MYNLPHKEFLSRFVRCYKLYIIIYAGGVLHTHTQARARARTRYTEIKILLVDV